MARPLRIQFPGAVYHTMARGIDKKEIFSNSSEKSAFLSLLNRLSDRYNFVFYAFCIMDNHYHLLLETPDANLSKGMQRLNGDYALWYNRKHVRNGTLFQDRYKAYLVDKENYLLALSRYIVLNPVRAAIVSHPSSYVWSSYQYTIGMKEPPDFLSVDSLLSLFSSDREDAQRQYRDFIYEDICENAAQGINDGPVIGGVDFLSKIESHFDKKRKVDEIPRKERFQNRLSLAEIFNLPDDRCIKKARDEKIYIAFRDHGYTQKEIADFLGMHYSSLSPIIKRREKIN